VPLKPIVHAHFVFGYHEDKVEIVRDAFGTTRS